MAESIMQTKKECYVTGSRINLDQHHVLFGVGQRSLSDKYGLWVWLRHDIHMSLHDHDQELAKRLKEEGQKAFEKTHTREEFRRIFGKSYL